MRSPADDAESCQWVTPQDAVALAKKIGAEYYEVNTSDYIDAYKPTSDISTRFRIRNPAGGVEDFFASLVIAAHNHLEAHPHQPSVKPPQPRPGGLLVRLMARFTLKQMMTASTGTSKLQAKSNAPFHDVDRFLSVLMCRHSRLGRACVEPMRKVPDEVWIKVFSLAWSPPVRFFPRA